MNTCPAQNESSAISLYIYVSVTVGCARHPTMNEYPQGKLGSERNICGPLFVFNNPGHSGLITSPAIAGPPLPFLAYLSWWTYSMTSLCCRRLSSAVCRLSSVVLSFINIFKHFLLWNHWTDWSQLLYGASMGWGNESMFAGSRSVDQDGHHAHIS